MKKLHAHFVPTGRSVEPLGQGVVPPGGWGYGGCAEMQWQMMAISYVNKQFLYDKEEEQM